MDTAKFIIRPAAIEDMEALTALYLAYGEELKRSGLHYDIRTENVPKVLESRIKSRLIYFAAAESAGEIVGFVIASILRLGGEYLCGGEASVGYLNDIYVAPAARRQGLAEALTASAEAWLRENGVRAMELQVVTGNTAGEAFWRRQGAYPVGTLCYKKL